MTDQIPMFPKATSMFIHSGNIINWNRLKRKPNLSPTDELCDCVGKSLDDFLKASDLTSLQYVTEVYKVNTDSVEKLDDTERQETKITVKVFMCIPQPPAAIAEAVNKVLSELDTSYVETLLLSVSPLLTEEEDSEESNFGTGQSLDWVEMDFHSSVGSLGSSCENKGRLSLDSRKIYEKYKKPGSLPSRVSRYSQATKYSMASMASKRPVRFTLPVKSMYEDKMSLDRIQPYWEVMEELVSADKVLSLGVCDLNKDVLEDLYNWAKVKPVINQVNLESCCVMPKDLVEYAKQTSVQLLTHNDSPVFITKEQLQETIQTVSTERDSDAWCPQWVVRYSGIIKCRGIIKMKGYVFHALRDNKKRVL